MLNFEITDAGLISQLFLSVGMTTFLQAAEYIKQLPYGRNANKRNLATIFSDQCGTCSTKHAVLKVLADENRISGLHLMIGMYRMNAKNTPPVAEVLSQFNLEYIPEAHCYLRFGDLILDYTKYGDKLFEFLPDLLEEKVITPEQIVDYKVNFHQWFMENWLIENPQLTYNLKELWTIRERCIQAIGD